METKSSYGKLQFMLESLGFIFIELICGQNGTLGSKQEKCELVLYL